MQKILSLGVNDVKNIFREQMLTAVFTLFPLLTIAAGIWMIPSLAERFPEIIPYYPLLLAFLIMQVSMGVGFVIAAIFLEEKDQDLLDVLRTVPLSANTFLAYRLLFGVMYMIGFTLLLVNVTQLVEVSAGESLIMALMFAIPAPMITLFMSIFANNKVEGLAIFKGLNFSLLLPAVAFALEGNMKHVFGFLPAHWMYQYVDAMANGSTEMLGYGVIAFVFGGGVIAGLIWYFRKKVF
ncbi:MAG: hypothetical protein AAFY71_09250 [Bacteroidota bacterium]